MHEFYKKALVVCFGLIAACVVLGYICVKQSYLQAPLLPAAASPLAWHGDPSWDARAGGKVLMHLYEAQQRLRFDYRLARKDQGFGGVELNFKDGKGQPIHIDLSRYSSISLLVKCSPANTLQLAIPTFVGRRSDQQEFLGYRVPLSYFSCDENESRVELDLTRLETPEWWYFLKQQALSSKDYKLDKVPKIIVGGSGQSPRDVTLEVQVRELNLKGRNRGYLVLFGVLLIVVWSGFGVWFFRQHAQALVGDVKLKLQKDLPFVAYQQLSLEPHRDKEKTAILQCIASRYADPELDLERVVEETGVNRNKVYDILKAEFGFTFSGYLNKLRLTEAARLLAEKDTATVAEIAYSVGYGNVSYFNKLFKEEYGCTPKAFRSACPVAEP